MKKIVLLLGFFSAVVLFTHVPPVSTDTGYAGAEACKGCHEGYYDSYARSPHGKKAVSGSPAAQFGCESCHGSGAEHVSKGGGKGVSIFGFGRKLDAKDKSAKCLACHEDRQHLINWNLSRHKSNGIGCTDCPSVHAGTGRSLKAAQPDLCFDCHKDIRLQSNKQSHHPIREGKVTCTDCHDTHGTFNAKMLRADTVNELCYTCHAEKRGPFRFEHPPVEANCLNCHAVHGSNHNSLLVRKPPQLCQSCHEAAFHPSTPYTKADGFGGTEPSNKLIGRACMNCHTNIHGSNGPDGRGLRFIR
ncbi:MAG: DmsE family decaheme c-type cytochrome [Nitrospirae bacterium]|nr:DmsE family decaheme c-type cytochrome [Nitrospirota bacterium]